MIQGKEHLIHNLIQKIREIFLNLGFDEIENPVFIQEEEIYKQYGKEAPVILDRVFYIGGLPRPDIGISDNDIAKIKNIAHITIFIRRTLLYNFGRVFE